MNAGKYEIGYFPVESKYNKWVTKDHIEKAPVWCSVDMRDGNQSLVIPMSLEEKLEFFSVLCEVGFKEIEVGFPAASETEYKFIRTLIKKKLIPFAWFSLGAFLRKPKVFMRLVRALLRPSESERKEKYVMFTSLGVDTTKTCRGAGSMLFNKGKESVDFSKFEYISLETDVENNDNTNHFHQKHGFKIFREFKTPEGRRMYEYRYYGPNAAPEGAVEEKETV